MSFGGINDGQTFVFDCRNNLDALFGTNMLRHIPDELCPLNPGAVLSSIRGTHQGVFILERMSGESPRVLLLHTRVTGDLAGFVAATYLRPDNSLTLVIVPEAK